MRKQFIGGGAIESPYTTASDGTYIDSDGEDYAGLPGIVAHDAPWAAIAVEVEVEGGYMAFESAMDYETWNNQG